MNIKKIVAIMAVKTNPKDEVGKLRVIGQGDVFGLDNTPEKEIEFYSEEDFEEPKRENFESMILELLNKNYRPEEHVEIHFLTECTN